VTVSLLYELSRRLLSVPALVRRDSCEEAELRVRRHENAARRRQLTSPIGYQLADRLWLTESRGFSSSGGSVEGNEGMALTVGFCVSERSQP
jgi:hypothetical protein